MKCRCGAEATHSPTGAFGHTHCGACAFRLWQTATRDSPTMRHLQELSDEAMRKRADAGKVTTEPTRSPFDQGNMPGALPPLPGCTSNECAIRNRCIRSDGCGRRLP